MSSCEGGQFVSQCIAVEHQRAGFQRILKFFLTERNVWPWSFGQTISKSMRSFMRLLPIGQSAAALARTVSST